MPSRRVPLVLLIEDDDEVRYGLESVLITKGFTPLSVRSAEQGITLLRRGLRPDLIVLDPVTANGGRLFRAEQASNPSWVTIPVIAGASIDDSAHRGPVSDHIPPSRRLSSPFTLMRFCALVDSCVAQSARTAGGESPIRES